MLRNNITLNRPYSPSIDLAGVSLPLYCITAALLFENRPDPRPKLSRCLPGTENRCSLPASWRLIRASWFLRGRVHAGGFTCCRPSRCVQGRDACTLPPCMPPAWLKEDSVRGCCSRDVVKHVVLQARGRKHTQDVPRTLICIEFQLHHIRWTLIGGGGGAGGTGGGGDGGSTSVVLFDPSLASSSTTTSRASCLASLASHVV